MHRFYTTMAQKRNQNRNRNKSFSFSFSFSHLVHFPAAFHHINNTADCARRGSRSSPTERACRPVSVQRLAIRQSTAATKHKASFPPSCTFVPSLFWQMTRHVSLLIKKLHKPFWFSPHLLSEGSLRKSDSLINCSNFPSMFVPSLSW